MASDEFDREPIEFLTPTDRELLAGWGWTEESAPGPTPRRPVLPSLLILTIAASLIGAGKLAETMTVQDPTHHPQPPATSRPAQDLSTHPAPIGPPGEPGGGIESVTVKHGHIYGLMFDGSTKDLGSIAAHR